MSTARSVLIDITPLRISPAFRRIFVARLISLIAIGLLLVSVPVQMWDLTQSSAQVGAATAVTGITTFVGMLLGGVLADRVDRKYLILTGRTAAALAFAGLTVNAFADTPSVAALYLLGGLDGLIGALSAAALMAAVPTLIARRHLAAVGALSAITVRIGTAVSPGIAGIVIGAAGVEWAYAAATVIATITVAILTGLPSMPPQAAIADDSAPTAPESAAAEPATTAPAPPPPLFAFLRSQRIVAAVMVTGVLAMFAPGVVALLPALVAERFGSNAQITGLMFAAVSVGALISAVASGWISSVARPGLLLAGTLTATFGLLILFGLAPFAWLAIGLLVIIGFGEAVMEVVRYLLIQQHTPGPLLGRVNGIWMAQEVGGVTVGALVAGALGSVWAAADAIVYYAAALLVAALLAAGVLGSLRTVRRDTETDPVGAN
ncbi:MAG: enterobactin transporter EntS [Gordonia sp. (in: high G+C Gram-positive bacteria)]